MTSITITLHGANRDGTDVVINFNDLRRAESFIRDELDRERWREDRALRMRIAELELVAKNGGKP